MNSPQASGKALCEQRITEAALLNDQLVDLAPRRRNKVMTVKKLSEQIRRGQGQGHGKEYQPWLQIRRGNSTSKSNQVVAWMPPLGRIAHYFSRGEYKVALLLLWLGADDLREQYPLWPVAHPHPLQGGAESIELPWVRGLIEIARDAGINHGVEVGTNIPYVATIDLLATLHTRLGPKLIGISCKPYGSPDAVVRPRSLERLELERRYFAEIGEKYWVANSALVSNSMAGQLELLIGAADLKHETGLILHSSRFAAYITNNPNLSMADAVVQAAQVVGIDESDGWQLFRYCSWYQLVDFDPTRPILTSHPIPRGGWALRSELRAEIFGVEAL